MDYFNGFNRNSYGLGSYPTQPNQIYPQNNYNPTNNSFGLKSGIQYASKTEMEALILPPSTQVMAMGKEGDVFYVKTADELGRSTMSVFSYKKQDENVSHETKEEYITRKEFEEFRKQCKDIETLLKAGSNGKEKKND